MFVAVLAKSKRSNRGIQPTGTTDDPFLILEFRILVSQKN